MIYLKETAIRLFFTGERAELRLIRERFRFRPSGYFHSQKFTIYTMTDGKEGWDGYIYPFQIVGQGNNTTGTVLRGRLPEVLAFCRKQRIEVDVSGLLPRPLASLSMQDVTPDLLVSEHELDERQRRTIHQWLIHGYGVGHMAVNSGKTMTFAGAAAMVRQHYPKAKVLYITFTERLVNQARKDFKAFLPAENITQFGGGKHDKDGDIVLTTVSMLNKHFRELLLSKWFQRFMVVMYDEVHHCFPRGTLVDGKPIESLKVGDSVRCVGVRGVEMRRIKRLYRAKTTKLVRLTVGSRQLLCTPNHPVYVFGTGYVEAENVAVGCSVVRCTTGWVWPQNDTRAEAGQAEGEILALERVDSAEILELGSFEGFERLCPEGDVYNLEVEGNHNYFANGYLVHNCGSDTSKKVLEAVPAYFRFGASGSRKADDPGRSADIAGYFGPVRNTVKQAELIEEGRSAKPHIYTVDVEAWHNKFKDVPYRVEANTPLWALVEGVWRKGTYLGPVIKLDEKGKVVRRKQKIVDGSVDMAIRNRVVVEEHPPENPEDEMRLVTIEEDVVEPGLNLARLDGDAQEYHIESKWCLLNRVYDKAITRFRERNELIRRWAAHYSGQGHPTVVVCTRTLHIHILHALISEVVDKELVRTLHGEDSTTARDEAFAWFKDTPGSILITPLIKEGVSIAEIRAGVVADYVSDYEVADQIIGRFIRKKKEGPNTSEITWFVDRQHPTLRRGCLGMLERLKQIEGYSFFDVPTPESLGAESAGKQVLH